MKKLLVTILALVYLGTSSGAIMHLHYCMGKLAETSYSNESSKTCSKCGMKKTQKKAGCCKDESKFVKNTTDQKAGVSNFEFNNTFGIQEQTPVFQIPVPVLQRSLLVNYAPHAPPDKQAAPIYLRVCSFLI